MGLLEWYNRQIPEYYDTMYLDGYTPQQILYAKHRQMYNDYLARKEAQKAAAVAQPEVIIPNITFKSQVTIK